MKLYLVKLIKEKFCKKGRDEVRKKEGKKQVIRRIKWRGWKEREREE
jgi:hypothetical protein